MTFVEEGASVNINRHTVSQAPSEPEDVETEITPPPCRALSHGTAVSEGRTAPQIIGCY